MSLNPPPSRWPSTTTPNASVRLINRIEWVKREIEEMQKMEAPDASRHALMTEAKGVEQKIDVIEERLLDRTIAEGDQKSFRGPLGLYLKFVWLGAEVGTGGADVSGNSDFPPTAAETEVFAELHKQLDDTGQQFTELTGGDLAHLNQRMSSAGLMRIAVPAQP